MRWFSVVHRNNQSTFKFVGTARLYASSRYFSALKETIKNAHDDACDQLRTAQHHQKEYDNQQVNAERFSVRDQVLVYDPVNRGFPKFQKHYVGPYVVEAKPIVNGVSFILRSPDNGNIVYKHRNRLKKCNVSFLEQHAVDVLMDQFSIFLEQHAQNLQILDAAANVNPEAILPVADTPAAVPLVAPADQPQPAQQERAARPPVAERPRREVRPPDRLVNRYTPSLGENKRKKK